MLTDGQLQTINENRTAKGLSQFTREDAERELRRRRETTENLQEDDDPVLFLTGLMLLNEGTGGFDANADVGSPPAAENASFTNDTGSGGYSGGGSTSDYSGSSDTGSSSSDSGSSSGDTGSSSSDV